MARADLGLLLVHGIGRQRQGDTLAPIANALLDWLRARGDGVRVEVERARLKDAQRPAEAVLVLRGPRSTRRILLVESFWADAFDPPGFFGVLRWVLGSGGWLVFRHLVNLPRRWQWWQPHLSPGGDVEKALSVVLGVVALFLVVLPFQLAGLVLALLWLVPIPAFRGFLDRVFAIVAEQLGDSFVFAGDPVLRRALADRVARDLERVVADRVVVVAHSQGAAVSLDMLEAHPAPPPLVTYGAGIRKLEELAGAPDTPTPTPWFFSLLWLFALVSLAALGVIVGDVQRALAGDTTPNQLAGLGWTFVFGLVVAASWAASTAFDRDARVDRNLAPRLNALLRRQPRWLDVYATMDFVPAGPLLATHPYRREKPDVRWHTDHGPPTLRIVNLLSPLGDHNAYWQNPAGFVDPLVAWLRETPALDWLPTPPAAKPIWRPLRVWLRFLLSLGLTLLVLALFVAARDTWQAIVPGFEAVWARLLDDVPTTFTAWIGEPGWTLAAVYQAAAWMAVLGAHLIAFAVYERFLLGAVWQGLDRQLSLHPPTRGPEVAVAALRALAYLTLVAATAAVLWQAVAAGSYAPLWTAPLEALLHLHAALLLPAQP